MADFSPEIKLERLQEIARNIAGLAVTVIARLELGHDLALPFEVPLQLADPARGARQKPLEQITVHAMSNVTIDVGSIGTLALFAAAQLVASET